jgi:uncharacterized protein YecE (DUF72 family)
MTVLVGTAGFSYKDWKSTFYPDGISPARMLEEYARHFGVVEINSTYYAIPPPERINAMARRTPPDFQFTVKCNREMTHEISGDPGVTAGFREAIRPLENHGKLGGVLAQFPWGFKNTRDNRGYLERLAERMRGVDTVVEFRNNEWDAPETFDLLRRLGLCYCCVDEPRLQGLLSPRVEVTGPVAYVRFHGRNQEAWWDQGRQSWERYDYLYSEDELSDWVPKVEVLSESADRTYIIFNNHYKGQAPANARAFEKMLRGLLGDAVLSVDTTATVEIPPDRLFD